VRRTKSFIIISLLAMGVVLTGSTIVFSALAEDQGTTPDPQLPVREPPWMSQLTDDQKEQLQQVMDSLRDSGATPEEIRDAVNAKLQEWGIEAPQDNGGQPPEPPWMRQLTDDQKQEIQQLMDSLRASGASQQEIRDAVSAKLEGWGIELPEDNGVQPPQAPWMSQLTDDQKQEIQQLADSLRDSGATPEQIRDAVNAKLQEWGITLPADNGRQPREPPWMSQLTDDQKQQIHQLVNSLRSSGATPEEIRHAVNAKLQEWGIEVPAPPQTSEQ